MKKINSIAFIIIVISGITLCSSNTKNEIMYKNAVKYISTDKDFVQMLKDFNRYNENLLFKNDQLVYKVYPEIMNEFFKSFEHEIDSLLQNGKVVSFNKERMEKDVRIDSTMAHFSVSDTANVQIFFTGIEGNLLSAEVFTRTQKYSPRFDGYGAIGSSNVGMRYLFLFKNGEIDEVYNHIVQYN